MRKLLNIIAVLALVLATGCMEELAPAEVTGEGDGWLTIDFSAKEGLEVTT